ncbi:MAG: hypothetical protein RLZZ63_87 [Gemmatimonadota bacterium]|jgi:hypothetical protein
MTQFSLPGRLMRRVLLLSPFTAGPLLAQGTAPTPTEAVARCLDGAATAFVQCLADLPWYAEGLCYSKYAADGVLCAPATLLKFMMA